MSDPTLSIASVLMSVRAQGRALRAFADRIDSIESDLAERLAIATDSAVDHQKALVMAQAQNMALKAQLERLVDSTQRWIRCLLLANGGRPVTIPALMKADSNRYELARDDDKESDSVTFRLIDKAAQKEAELEAEAVAIGEAEEQAEAEGQE